MRYGCRLHCLDGLRGALALYVMASHAAPFAAMPGWIAGLFSHGQAAVDVFFMLSGLVIVRSWTAHDGRPAPFLAARFRRTYPLYLLVFAASVPARLMPCVHDLPWAAPGAADLCGAGWPAYGSMHLVLHLAMAHGLFPAAVLPDAWVAFLGPAWSLSVEWQFYGIVALVAGRGGRDSPRFVVGLLALATAGVAWEWLTPELWHFSRAFLPNKAHYFAVGLASAALIEGRPGSARGLAITIAAALAVCLAREAAPGKALPLLIWLMALMAERGRAPMLAWLLRRPAMLRLGAWSYGIYLVNEPIQKVMAVSVATLTGSDLWFDLLWLPLALGVPVILAGALHPWERQMATTSSKRLRSMPTRPSSV